MIVKLNEDTKNQLLNKSKSSVKGKERFNKRTRSRVVNNVAVFNEIDMNKLFKQDILTINVPVRGETDNYKVKISFGGFLDILHNNIKDREYTRNDIIRAIQMGMNREDVYISCTCPDAKYRMDYWQTQTKIKSGEPQNIPSNITNPRNTLGAGCKHTLLVLSNNGWLIRVASVIYNYIEWAKVNFEKGYAEIIYPAIYKKEYEEPVQLSLLDKDELDTDTTAIDLANKASVDRGRFKQGNTSGIRFARDDDTEGDNTLFDT